MNLESITFLKSLPRHEKAELMEYIALELAQEDEGEILQEIESRLNDYKNGKMSARSWEEIKSKYHV